MEGFKGTIINVGVAEWKIASGDSALRTTLGSCVGIVLYSAAKKFGALGHVLLSEPPQGKIVARGKYARTAIDVMLVDLKKAGVESKDLTARIYGGASMFESISSSFLNNIGNDNVRVTKEVLSEHKIPLLHEETGGNAGRTITLFTNDGRLLLRAGGQERFNYKATQA